MLSVSSAPVVADVLFIHAITGNIIRLISPLSTIKEKQTEAVWVRSLGPVELRPFGESGHPPVRMDFLVASNVLQLKLAMIVQ